MRLEVGLGLVQVFDRKLKEFEFYFQDNKKVLKSGQQKSVLDQSFIFKMFVQVIV